MTRTLVTGTLVTRTLVTGDTCDTLFVTGDTCDKDTCDSYMGTFVTL